MAVGREAQPFTRNNKQYRQENNAHRTQVFMLLCAVTQQIIGYYTADDGTLHSRLQIYNTADYRILQSTLRNIAEQNTE